MIGGPSDIPGGAGAQDAARLLEALKRMRDSQRGRSLDRLPWYLLIGPSGAGKTTALLNSGLQFHLADEGSDQAPADAATAGYQVLARGRGRACRQQRAQHIAVGRRRGGQGRLGWLPAAPETVSAAATAQWRRRDGRPRYGRECNVRRTAPGRARYSRTVARSR